VDVAGRDVGGYVEQARRMVEAEVPLPTGYRLEWSGEFEHMERAAPHDACGGSRRSW
jgi:Cu(I)/Ag(I) efflux system membrane protein CusA/SilA